MFILPLGLTLTTVLPPASATRYLPRLTNRPTGLLSMSWIGLVFASKAARSAMVRKVL